MRKVSLLIVTLSIAVSALALVPPRDPSRRAEWQLQVAAQANKGEVDAINSLRRMPAATQAVGERVIIPRVLVITVSFANFAFTTPMADVDSMFNGQNWNKDGAKGSVRQYFRDQSMGQYDPQFDVVGPVSLSQGYAYYGAGSNGAAKVGYMVTEACDSVDNIVDFTQYDSDNDGRVDLVYILYAGYGENDNPNAYVQSVIPVWSNLIWPAYYNVVSAGYGSNKRIFDGKYIYACEYSNELDAYYSTADTKMTAGIGTACHEFGHALGLPDLYQTTGSNTGCGIWDVMDWGMYNDDTYSPPSYSSYERFYMGWLTPMLITEGDTLTLEHIATSNEAYMVTLPDTSNLDGLNPAPSDFYLLENRQQTGWDRGLPGSGMLMTHVRYNRSKWTSNTVNNTSPLGVEIIRADGDNSSAWYGQASDLFPEGATQYLGITDHAIEQITMSAGVIRFVYRGGVDTTPTDSVATAQPLINRPAQVCKTIRNGQVLIHTPNGLYNMLGIKQDY